MTNNSYRDLGSLTEDELIDAAGRGHAPSFGALLHGVKGPVFAFLLRSCGDHALAEDLFQETAFKLWRGLTGYQHRGRFVAWAFQVARNVLRDELRKRQRRIPVGGPDPVVGSINPVETVLTSELEEIIRSSVHHLPVEQRDVFLLRQLSDLTFQEIAESLQLPLGTVLSRMNYATRKVKMAVKRYHDQ